MIAQKKTARISPRRFFSFSKRYEAD